MLMNEVQTEKKFQAKVPIAIWREWEQWLEGRGTLNNTQIMVGLLRLFLSAPEDIQLKALFGRHEDLASALQREWVAKQIEADDLVAEAQRYAQEQRQKADHRGRKAGG